MLHWATNQREKDCLLLSLIAVLAGCMYTVYGYYDRKKYSPHLFAFFTAGAGQGKGIRSSGPDVEGVGKATGKIQNV